MDHIDIASFLGTSFVIAYLTNISGVELVAMQVIWFGIVWVGKRLIDHWVNRTYA